MASMLKDIVTGCMAGLVGVMAHAGVAQTLYNRTMRTDPEALRREEEIEPREPFIILAQKVGRVIGSAPSKEQEQQFAELFTLGMGATMGALYVIAARRWPLDWLVGGVTFGTLFWAIEDEAIGPAIGLAGDNTKYPVEAHVRGLAAHVAFGIVTAALAKSLGVRPESGPWRVNQNGINRRKIEAREEHPVTV